MSTSVLLKGEEREVALAEVIAVRDAVPKESSYREALEELIATLEDGAEVDGDQAAELDRLLVLALQSGRVRALYGPGGEQAALRAYRRLPSGAEVAESAAEVNEALSALLGRRLEAVSLSAVGPGAFSLSLTLDGVELTVRLDRQGARLGSVGI